MIRDDLKGASERLLKIVVEQGERRLAAQCSFADAQDQRAGTILQGASSFAAAAAAISAGSAAAGLGHVLFVASVVALAGFSAAAACAAWSVRPRGFHSCGFYPEDFAEDLRSDRSERDILCDFALDLQHRLVGNKGVLSRRGRWSSAAMWTMLFTPILAAFAAWAFR